MTRREPVPIIVVTVHEVRASGVVTTSYGPFTAEQRQQLEELIASFGLESNGTAYAGEDAVAATKAIPLVWLPNDGGS